MKSAADQKRIVSLQDISCLGQCSLTVALPILSAMGHETVILPSAVLSTHTGNWKGFTFRDLTDDIPPILDHWESYGIKFDGIYTGYIGNPAQFDMALRVKKSFLNDGAALIIDPAMADYGKLYTGFDQAFVKKMADYASNADYLLPNITEAAFMVGMDYRERLSYDSGYIEALVNALLDTGAKNVVLTGVEYKEGEIGVCVCNRDERKMKYYFGEKLPTSVHGTGDIFASVFTGALIKGFDALEAASKAAKFVCMSIENTPSTHVYGANFEGILSKVNDL